MPVHIYYPVSYLGNVALLVLIWQNHAHAGLGSQVCAHTIWSASNIQMA
jgi:hypothetical protein